eukprot:7110512-Pyramimonas_sp.AAC.1
MHSCLSTDSSSLTAHGCVAATPRREMIRSRGRPGPSDTADTSSPKLAPRTSTAGRPPSLRRRKR